MHQPVINSYDYPYEIESSQLTILIHATGSHLNKLVCETANHFSTGLWTQLLENPPSRHTVAPIVGGSAATDSCNVILAEYRAAYPRSTIIR